MKIASVSAKTMKRLVAGTVAASLFFTVVAEPYAESSFWTERQAARTREGAGPTSAQLQSIPWPQESLNPALGAYRLPPGLGNVVESRAPAPGGPTFILVQDAHGVYGAQYNASLILEGLRKAGWTEGAVPVYQEGGVGPANIDWLCEFPFADIKERVARAHLRKGDLTGEEYRALASSSGTYRLVGVETEGLYKKNLAARHGTSEARAKAEAHIDGVRDQLEKRKREVYPAGLLAVDRPRQAYQARTIGFVQYAQALEKLAPEGVAETAYPSLAGLLRLIRLEAGLDFEALKREREELARGLARRMTEQAVKELTAQAVAAREGRMTPAAFYQGLLALAEGLNRGGEELPTRELRRYVGYLRLSEGLRHERLPAEAEAFYGRLAEQMATTEEARRLRALDERVSLERLLWKHELTPDEYAKFKEAGPLNWAEVARALSGREDGSATGKEMSDLSWTGSFERVRSYYDLALERDQALARNALADMERTGVQRGVLIAGGFHTPGLTRALREAGAGYVVVQPAFEAEGPTKKDLLITQDPDAFSHSVREMVRAVWPSSPHDPSPLKTNLVSRMALSMFASAIKWMVQPRSPAKDIEGQLAAFSKRMDGMGIANKIYNAEVVLKEGGRSLVIYGQFRGELFFIAQSLDAGEQLAFVSETYREGDGKSLNDKLGSLRSFEPNTLPRALAEFADAILAMPSLSRSARAAWRARTLGELRSIVEAAQSPTTTTAEAGEAIIQSAPTVAKKSAHHALATLADQVKKIRIPLPSSAPRWIAWGVPAVLVSGPAFGAGALDIITQWDVLVPGLAALVIVLFAAYKAASRSKGERAEKNLPIEEQTLRFLETGPIRFPQAWWTVLIQAVGALFPARGETDGGSEESFWARLKKVKEFILPLYTTFGGHGVLSAYVAVKVIKREEVAWEKSDPEMQGFQRELDQAVEEREKLCDNPDLNVVAEGVRIGGLKIRIENLKASLDEKRVAHNRAAFDAVIAAIEAEIALGDRSRVVAQPGDPARVERERAARKKMVETVLEQLKTFRENPIPRGFQDTRISRYFYFGLILSQMAFAVTYVIFTFGIPGFWINIGSLIFLPVTYYVVAPVMMSIAFFLLSLLAGINTPSMKRFRKWLEFDLNGHERVEFLPYVRKWTKDHGRPYTVEELIPKMSNDLLTDSLKPMIEKSFPAKAIKTMKVKPEGTTIEIDLELDPAKAKGVRLDAPFRRSLGQIIKGEHPSLPDWLEKEIDERLGFVGRVTWKGGRTNDEGTKGTLLITLSKNAAQNPLRRIIKDHDSGLVGGVNEVWVETNLETREITVRYQTTRKPGAADSADFEESDQEMEDRIRWAVEDRWETPLTVNLEREPTNPAFVKVTLTPGPRSPEATELSPSPENLFDQVFNMATRVQDTLHADPDVWFAFRRRDLEALRPTLEATKGENGEPGSYRHFFFLVGNTENDLVKYEMEKMKELQDEADALYGKGRVVYFYLHQSIRWFDSNLRSEKFLTANRGDLLNKFKNDIRVEMEDGSRFQVTVKGDKVTIKNLSDDSVRQTTRQEAEQWLSELLANENNHVFYPRRFGAKLGNMFAASELMRGQLNPSSYNDPHVHEHYVSSESPLFPNSQLIRGDFMAFYGEDIMVPFKDGTAVRFRLVNGEYEITRGRLNRRNTFVRTPRSLGTMSRKNANDLFIQYMASPDRGPRLVKYGSVSGNDDIMAAVDCVIFLDDKNELYVGSVENLISAMGHPANGAIRLFNTDIRVTNPPNTRGGRIGDYKTSLITEYLKASRDTHVQFASIPLAAVFGRTTPMYGKAGGRPSYALSFFHEYINPARALSHDWQESVYSYTEALYGAYKTRLKILRGERVSSDAKRKMPARLVSDIQIQRGDDYDHLRVEVFINKENRIVARTSLLDDQGVYVFDRDFTWPLSPGMLTEEGYLKIVRTIFATRSGQFSVGERELMTLIENWVRDFRWLMGDWQMFFYFSPREYKKAVPRAHRFHLNNILRRHLGDASYATFLSVLIVMSYTAGLFVVDNPALQTSLFVLALFGIVFVNQFVFPIWYRIGEETKILDLTTPTGRPGGIAWLQDAAPAGAGSGAANGETMREGSWMTRLLPKGLRLAGLASLVAGAFLLTGSPLGSAVLSVSLAAFPRFISLARRHPFLAALLLGAAALLAPWQLMAAAEAGVLVSTADVFISLALMGVGLFLFNLPSGLRGRRAIYRWLWRAPALVFAGIFRGLFFTVYSTLTSVAAILARPVVSFNSLRFQLANKNLPWALSSAASLSEQAGKRFYESWDAQGNYSIVRISLILWTLILLGVASGNVFAAMLTFTGLLVVLVSLVAGWAFAHPGGSPYRIVTQREVNRAVRTFMRAGGGVLFLSGIIAVVYAFVSGADIVGLAGAIGFGLGSLAIRLSSRPVPVRAGWPAIRRKAAVVILTVSLAAAAVFPFARNYFLENRIASFSPPAVASKILGALRQTIQPKAFQMDRMEIVNLRTPKIEGAPMQTPRLDPHPDMPKITRSPVAVRPPLFDLPVVPSRLPPGVPVEVSDRILKPLVEKKHYRAAVLEHLPTWSAPPPAMVRVDSPRTKGPLVLWRGAGDGKDYAMGDVLKANREVLQLFLKEMGFIYLPIGKDNKGAGVSESLSMSYLVVTSFDPAWKLTESGAPARQMKDERYWARLLPLYGEVNKRMSPEERKFLLESEEDPAWTSFVDFVHRDSGVSSNTWDPRIKTMNALLAVQMMMEDLKVYAPELTERMAKDPREAWRVTRVLARRHQAYREVFEKLPHLYRQLGSYVVTGFMHNGLEGPFDPGKAFDEELAEFALAPVNELLGKGEDWYNQTVPESFQSLIRERVLLSKREAGREGEPLDPLELRQQVLTAWYKLGELVHVNKRGLIPSTPRPGEPLSREVLEDAQWGAAYADHALSLADAERYPQVRAALIELPGFLENIVTRYALRIREKEDYLRTAPESRITGNEIEEERIKNTRYLSGFFYKAESIWAIIENEKDINAERSEKLAAFEKTTANDMRDKLEFMVDASPEDLEEMNIPPAALEALLDARMDRSEKLDAAREILNRKAARRPPSERARRMNTAWTLADWFLLWDAQVDDIVGTTGAERRTVEGETVWKWIDTFLDTYDHFARKTFYDTSQPQVTAYQRIPFYNLDNGFVSQFTALRMKWNYFYEQVGGMDFWEFWYPRFDRAELMLRDQKFREEKLRDPEGGPSRFVNEVDYFFVHKFGISFLWARSLRELNAALYLANLILDGEEKFRGDERRLVRRDELIRLFMTFIENMEGKDGAPSKYPILVDFYRGRPGEGFLPQMILLALSYADKYPDLTSEELFNKLKVLLSLRELELMLGNGPDGKPWLIDMETTEEVDGVNVWEGIKTIIVRETEGPVGTDESIRVSALLKLITTYYLFNMGNESDLPRAEVVPLPNADQPERLANAMKKLKQILYALVILDQRVTAVASRNYRPGDIDAGGFSSVMDPSQPLHRFIAGTGMDACLLNTPEQIADRLNEILRLADRGAVKPGDLPAEVAAILNDAEAPREAKRVALKKLIYDQFDLALTNPDPYPNVRQLFQFRGEKEVMVGIAYRQGKLAITANDTGAFLPIFPQLIGPMDRHFQERETTFLEGEVVEEIARAAAGIKQEALRREAKGVNSERDFRPSDLIPEKFRAAINGGGAVPEWLKKRIEKAGRMEEWRGGDMDIQASVLADTFNALIAQMAAQRPDPVAVTSAFSAVDQADSEEDKRAAAWESLSTLFPGVIAPETGEDGRELADRLSAAAFRTDLDQGGEVEIWLMGHIARAGLKEEWQSGDERERASVLARVFNDIVLRAVTPSTEPPEVSGAFSSVAEGATENDRRIRAKRALTILFPEGFARPTQTFSTPDQMMPIQYVMSGLRWFLTALGEAEGERLEGPRLDRFLSSYHETLGILRKKYHADDLLAARDMTEPDQSIGELNGKLGNFALIYSWMDLQCFGADAKPAFRDYMAGLGFTGITEVIEAVYSNRSVILENPFFQEALDALGAEGRLAKSGTEFALPLMATLNPRLSREELLALAPHIPEVIRDWRHYLGLARTLDDPGVMYEAMKRSMSWFPGYFDRVALTAMDMNDESAVYMVVKLTYAKLFFVYLSEKVEDEKAILDHWLQKYRRGETTLAGIVAALSGNLAAEIGRTKGTADAKFLSELAERSPVDIPGEGRRPNPWLKVLATARGQVEFYENQKGALQQGADSPDEALAENVMEELEVNRGMHTDNAAELLGYLDRLNDTASKLDTLLETRAGQTPALISEFVLFLFLLSLAGSLGAWGRGRLSNAVARQRGTNSGIALELLHNLLSVGAPRAAGSPAGVSLPGMGFWGALAVAGGGYGLTHWEGPLSLVASDLANLWTPPLSGDKRAADPRPGIVLPLNARDPHYVVAKKKRPILGAGGEIKAQDVTEHYMMFVEGHTAFQVVSIFDNGYIRLIPRATEEVRTRWGASFRLFGPDEGRMSNLRWERDPEKGQPIFHADFTPFNNAYEGRVTLRFLFDEGDIPSTRVQVEVTQKFPYGMPRRVALEIPTHFNPLVSETASAPTADSTGVLVHSNVTRELEFSPSTLSTHLLTEGGLPVPEGGAVALMNKGPLRARPTPTVYAVWGPSDITYNGHKLTPHVKAWVQMLNFKWDSFSDNAWAQLFLSPEKKPGPQVENEPGTLILRYELGATLPEVDLTFRPGPEGRPIVTPVEHQRMPPVRANPESPRPDPAQRAPAGPPLTDSRPLSGSLVLTLPEGFGRTGEALNAWGMIALPFSAGPKGEQRWLLPRMTDPSLRRAALVLLSFMAGDVISAPLDGLVAFADPLLGMAGGFLFFYGAIFLWRNRIVLVQAIRRAGLFMFRVARTAGLALGRISAALADRLMKSPVLAGVALASLAGMLMAGAAATDLTNALPVLFAMGLAPFVIAAPTSLFQLPPALENMRGLGGLVSAGFAKRESPPGLAFFVDLRQETLTSRGELEVQGALAATLTARLKELQRELAVGEGPMPPVRIELTFTPDQMATLSFNTDTNREAAVRSLLENAGVEASLLRQVQFRFVVEAEVAAEVRELNGWSINVLTVPGGEALWRGLNISLVIVVLSGLLNVEATVIFTGTEARAVAEAMGQSLQKDGTFRLEKVATPIEELGEENRKATLFKAQA